MKNGFAQHNVLWTSPSAINTWVYSKKNWVLNYLFGQRTPVNAAMKRGTVIEDAVVSVLIGDKSEEAAVNDAVNRFNREMTFSNDPRMEIERESITPSIKQAVVSLSIYGRPDFMPNSKQHKINTVCRTDQWSLPVVGYLDLVYPQHKLIIDIKTTHNIPKNGITAPHRRQGAVYAHAMADYTVKFNYVTPNETAIHTIDRVPETMAEIKQIILEMEVFLSSSDDKNVLLDQLTTKEKADVQHATI